MIPTISLRPMYRPVYQADLQTRYMAATDADLVRYWKDACSDRSPEDVGTQPGKCLSRRCRRRRLQSLYFSSRSMETTTTQTSAVFGNRIRA